MGCEKGEREGEREVKREGGRQMSQHNGKSEGLLRACSATLSMGTARHPQ